MLPLQDQSVSVVRVTSVVCRYEKHTEQINAVCGQSALYLMLNPTVYMLTARV